MRRRSILILAVALLAGGCASHPPLPSLRPLGPGERSLPGYQRPADGGPVLCAGGGPLERVVLHGSATDPRLTWITWPDGHREEVGWVPGSSARFTPDLEVIGPTGDLVATEGSVVTGMCPIAIDPGVTYVDFTVGAP